jgi:cytochrome c biogenesis protein CcmG/thiol:disulfide interchange protein DsbE
MRRVLWIVAALALVVVLVVGLTQAGEERAASSTPAPRFDLAQATARLAGAPAPLAALYKQPNTLLGGSRRAFNARMASLRGHPVVVNKWASWCRPCRAEFPIFQQVAAERGKEIAFIGLNSKDKAPAARKFLAARPLPYPSYQDPDEDIGRALKTPAAYPVTVFVDARGRTETMHMGEYTSARELSADIDRYLR